MAEQNVYFKRTEKNRQNGIFLFNRAENNGKEHKRKENGTLFSKEPKRRNRTEGFFPFFFGNRTERTFCLKSMKSPKKEFSFKKDGKERTEQNGLFKRMEKDGHN